MPPWFTLPPHEEKPKEAVVIGAGLAGSGIAYALGKRGWQVTVLEREEDSALKASSNDAGVYMPVLGHADDPVYRFTSQSYRYLLEHLPRVPGIKYDPCGVLQLADADSKGKQPRKAAALGSNDPIHDDVRFVTAEEASRIAGVPLTHDAAYFPQAGWAAPRSICRAQLTAYPNITLQTHKEVALIEYDNAEKHWIIYDPAMQTIAHTRTLVVASAIEAITLWPVGILPLTMIRGQLTIIPQTPLTSSLNTVLSHEVQFLPAIQGQHSIGATFQMKNANPSTTFGDNNENISKLLAFLPQLEDQISVKRCLAKTGFRTATPDRLPIIGPMPEQEHFQEDYKDYFTPFGQKKPYPPTPRYHPGLYVSLGYGSRGITTTPFASEILACLITGEPVPCEETILHSLLPVRFLARELKKKAQSTNQSSED